MAAMDTVILSRIEEMILVLLLSSGERGYQLSTSQIAKALVDYGEDVDYGVVETCMNRMHALGLVSGAGKGQAPRGVWAKFLRWLRGH